MLFFPPLALIFLLFLFHRILHSHDTFHSHLDPKRERTGWRLRGAAASLKVRARVTKIKEKERRGARVSPSPSASYLQSQSSSGHGHGTRRRIIRRNQADTYRAGLPSQCTVLLRRGAVHAFLAFLLRKSSLLQKADRGGREGGREEAPFLKRRHPASSIQEAPPPRVPLRRSPPSFNPRPLCARRLGLGLGRWHGFSLHRVGRSKLPRSSFALRFFAAAVTPGVKERERMGGKGQSQKRTGGSWGAACVARGRKAGGRDGRRHLELNVALMMMEAVLPPPPPLQLPLHCAQQHLLSFPQQGRK